MPETKVEKVFPVKTRLVEVTYKKTGVKYIEERQYRYDPEKKQNVVLSSRRTGKKIVAPGTEPVRCRPKKPSAASQKETPVVAERRNVRALDLVSHAGRVAGVEGGTVSAYPNGGTGDKLRSTAQYLVATGDTVHRIEKFQLNHDLPYSEGMSEDVCYALFDELGNDESGMQSLFRNFSELSGKEKQQAIAFDTTSHSTYSKNLVPYARKGFNKDGDGLDIYKVATFFSLDSGLPVSFEMQPGNISDMSSLLNAVKRAGAYGLNNPELVLDNGFFSRDNVVRMLRSHIKFTVLGTLADQWIYRHLDTPGEGGLTLRRVLDAEDFESQCPFDLNVHGTSVRRMTEFAWTRERSRGGKKAGELEEQKFRLHFHFYRNDNRALIRRQVFRDRLRQVKQMLEKDEELSPANEKFASEYFDYSHENSGRLRVTPKNDAINDAVKDFGVFVIITNIHKDRWEALRYYRRRNVIERSYRVVKTDIDGRKPRVWSVASLRGKEICRHVALAYRFALEGMLRWVKEEGLRRSRDEKYSPEERANYGKAAEWTAEQSVEDVLDWFDCVEDVTVKNKFGSQRWTGESTKRDKAFLELFYAKKSWV